MRSTLRQFRDIVYEATKPYEVAGLTVTERQQINGAIIFDLSFRGTSETLSHRERSSSAHFTPHKVRKDVHSALNRLGCLSAPVLREPPHIARRTPRVTLGDVVKDKILSSEPKRKAIAPPPPIAAQAAALKPKAQRQRRTTVSEFTKLVTMMTEHMASHDEISRRLAALEALFESATKPA